MRSRPKQPDRLLAGSRCAVARRRRRGNAALLLSALIALGFGSSFGCDPNRDVETGTPGSSSRAPNVVLISIDTLRADHLGVYGYHRNTSPFLDSWVANDPNITLFENAISQYPSTMVSHRAIFTGLYPPHSSGISSNIDPRVKTLPEILRSRGYLTAGFTDGAMVHSEYGFGRGFDVYFDKGSPRSGSSATLRMVEEFVTQAGERPFFVFWHTYDVHLPYHPPEFTPKEWQARAETQGIDIADPYNPILRSMSESGTFEAVRKWPEFPRRLKVFTEQEILRTIAMYDASIQHVDSNIGKLIRFLEERDLYDETLIVLLSDHGEVHVPKPLEYGKVLNRAYWQIHNEHDHLNNETVRVPLIVKYPKNHPRSAARVSRYVSAGVDVAPTILDVCGVDDVPVFDGRILSDTTPRRTLTFFENLVFEHIGADRFRIFRFPTALDTRRYFEERPSEYATVDFSRNVIEYPAGFLEGIDYSNFSANVAEFVCPLEENLGKYFAYPVAVDEMFFAFSAPGKAIARLKRSVKTTRFRISLIGNGSPAALRLSVTATDESGSDRILLDEELLERGEVSELGGEFVRVDLDTHRVVTSPVPYEQLTFEVDGSISGKWVVLINGIPSVSAVPATSSEAKPIDGSDDALMRQLEALGYLDR